MLSRKILGLIAAASLPFSVLAAIPAHAAETCVVDDFTDASGSDSDGQRSLQFCLSNISPDGTITFATAGTPQTIEVTTNYDPFTVYEPVTIDGGGLVTIKPADGVLTGLLESEYVLTVKGLTFMGADVKVGPSGEGGAIRGFDFATITVVDSTFIGNSAADGGAIANNGDVVVRNSIFRNNQAVYDGGAIFTNQGGAVTVEDSVFASIIVDGVVTVASNSAGGDGGAIKSAGDFVQTGSTFVGNTAGADGGAVYSRGTTTSTGGSFDDNYALDSGGAIYSMDSYVGVDTSFTSNETDDWEGGALYVEDGNVTTTSENYSDNWADDGSDGDGGAIYVDSGDLTCNESQFTENEADEDGGAVYVDGAYTGNGCTYTDNDGDLRGGALFASGTVTSTDETFENNLGDDYGGAIYVIGDYVGLRTQFIDNEAYDDEGGAIYVLQGSVTSTDEKYQGNFADEEDDGLGGAIYTDDGSVTCNGSEFVDNEADNDGGAIYSKGDVTTNDCIFTGNNADDDGGAIFVEGYSFVHGGEFEGNFTNGGHGGAIYGDYAVTIDGALFDSNVADGDGGAINANDDVTDTGGSLYVGNRSLTGDGGAIWAYTVSVTDASFEGNSAESTEDEDDGNGGAIYVDEFDHLVADRSYFGLNTATGRGGAASVSGAISISNSTFYANSAEVEAGAIDNRDDLDEEVDGFVAFSTFVGNEAPTYGTLSWVNDELSLFGNLFLDEQEDGIVNFSTTTGLVDYGFNGSTSGQLALDNATSDTALELDKIALDVPAAATLLSRPAVPMGNQNALTVLISDADVEQFATDSELTVSSVDQLGETRLGEFFPGAEFLTFIKVIAKPYQGPLVTSVSASMQSGSAGQDPTIQVQGSRLDEVDEAMVETESLEIISQSESELVLSAPLGLEGKEYDLELFGSFGKLTIQAAIQNSQPQATSQESVAVWTKRIGDSVKMYAKNIIGVGKIQFLVDGEEVAWVNAVDESDPKLSLASGSEYLVRTVELNPGKNRFEIRLDGVRIWRATYVRK